jgi:hypothetical protein
MDPKALEPYSADGNAWFASVGPGGKTGRNRLQYLQCGREGGERKSHTASLYQIPLRIMSKSLQGQICKEVTAAGPVKQI